VVIGSWWATSEEADYVFFSTFYEMLERRVPVGEAVWRARRMVQQRLPHTLDWLAYTLFGDPLARPYLPEISGGYTTLECLSHDEFLRPGHPYAFRATIRRRPPVWYQDRLIQTEELPQQMRALFLAPGIQSTPPQPVDMQPAGQTMLQATIELTPPAVGDYPLLVQLMEGDEHMKTLQMMLKVREKPAGEARNG
jgi:hypothetical protein